MNQRHDLLAFGLLSLACAVFVLAAIFAPYAGSAYSFLKEWQTLIAGGLAIVAAVIAAHPVRKQLSRMNIQSSIMARDVLVRRLSACEGRQAKSKELLSGITSEFVRDLYFQDQWSDNPQPAIDPHWAFDACHKVLHVIRGLVEDQLSKADSLEVDAARRGVLQSAEALEECLEAIHRPDSSDLADPEWDLSAEDIAEIERKAEVARAELPAKIDELNSAASALDRLFVSEIDKLRGKIRNIDRLVVADQTGEGGG